MSRIHVFLIGGLVAFRTVLPAFAPAAGADSLPQSFDALLEPAESHNLIPTPAPIPPDSTTFWRHFYFTDDGVGHARWLRQDAYHDNGDGIVSAGDGVTLLGIYYLVQEVWEAYQGRVTEAPNCGGRTYEGVGEFLSEPVSPHPDMEPHAPFMLLWPHASYSSWGIWLDRDDNGIIDAGDTVVWDCSSNYIHLEIEKVAALIRLQGFDAVPAETTTWGALKTRYVN